MGVTVKVEALKEPKVSAEVLKEVVMKVDLQTLKGIEGSIKV